MEVEHVGASKRPRAGQRRSPKYAASQFQFQFQLKHPMFQLKIQFKIHPEAEGAEGALGGE